MLQSDLLREAGRQEQSWRAEAYLANHLYGCPGGAAAAARELFLPDSYMDPLTDASFPWLGKAIRPRQIAAAAATQSHKVHKRRRRHIRHV